MAKENAVNENAVLGVKEMNIFEKLSAISLEITNVNKNLSVGVGKSSYKAVGEADVLAAVKPAEAKFRVYSYPVHRTVIETGTIENESIDYQSQQKLVKKSLFERIEVTYRFVNMDNPDDFIDIVSYGDGIDTQDKSVGKAMTYADKYALLKAYKIITGDDPDQDPSDPLKGRQTRPVTPAPKKGVSPEVAKECEELGITLEQIAAKKGIKVADLTDDIIRPGLIILKKKRAAKTAQPETKEPEITVPNTNE